MPKKVLPNPVDYAWFLTQLTNRGFRPVSVAEFRNDFKRLKLKAPRPRPGREDGFLFFANGLTVRVWTTWLESENKMRDVDALVRIARIKWERNQGRLDEEHERREEPESPQRNELEKLPHHAT